MPICRPLFKQTPSSEIRWPACYDKACLLLAVIGFISPGAAAQSPPAAQSLAPCFTAKTIRLGQTASDPEYNYAVFIPKAYSADGDADRKWPLLLFLHGSGECGEDGVKQTTVGLPNHIRRRADDFPFITIMPQAHGRWFTGTNELAVWRMIEETVRDYRIDLDRVYISGLSMGGFATWDFIMKRPDVFAAAIPVCGKGDVNYAANAKEMPIWAFHGAKDAAVPVAGSRDPIEALRKIGAKPRYTEYPDGDHYIWDRVYGGERIYDWLLSHKRAPAPSKFAYTMMQSAARVWWLSMLATDQPASAPGVRAEVKDGVVTLRTNNIAGWIIASVEPPLERGTTIKVIWNDQMVFEGPFPGVIRLMPPAADESPASQPSTNGEPTSKPG